MKILIVTQYFWPEIFQINNLALSLQNNGNSVEILTGKPNYPNGKVYPGYRSSGTSSEYWEGVKIHRVPIFPRGINSKFRLVLNYISFIFSGLLFGPFVAKNKYDVIFVFGTSPIFQAIPGLFLGRIRSLPVVLWVQDLWPESVSATGYVKSQFALKFLEKMVSSVYRLCDLILISSNGFFDSVKKLAPNKRVSYFPNTVGDNFSCSEADRAPKVANIESGFVVMFAGNIGVAQSFETILNAAKHLAGYPKIKIVILGGGAKFSWVESEIKKRGLSNVFLEGQFPLEDMPGILRRASVLLLTLSNHRIFNLTVPSKLQAYLAVGRPIIACLNGEGARIIDESGAGLSVAAEDFRGLASAIVKMYEMPKSALDEYGKNGRDYFKAHFDNQLLVNQLLDHFKNTKVDSNKVDTK